MSRRPHLPFRRLALFVTLVAFAVLPASASDEVLTVSPAAPTELDSLTFTLTGEWRDSCTPQLVGAELSNGVLDIEATLQFPGKVCLPAVTPYEVSIEVGRLPVGTYDVRVSGIPNFPPPVVVARIDLEVVASAELGLEAIDVAPVAPTTQDRFTLAASGEWPDGCVPRLDSVDVEDRTIRLFAIAEGEVCLQVVSRYFLARAVGPLEEGEYDVEIRIADRRFGDTTAGYQLAGSRSLTVGPKQSDVLIVGGRFAITVTWNAGTVRGGVGQPVRGALPEQGETGSGAFYFFGPENTELLVKVLDGCSVNDHYWVFISAATDLGFEVLVEDLAVDGIARTYSNESGETAVAVTDVEAFATCE